MAAYYNEIEPYAAQWLRNLIAAGHIAPGDVDERDIRDVRPDDLRGYTQCHFFAGIGVWSYALRLAGWSDDRPVWTGSCPCQPFSQAGQGAGFDDERHVWPAWDHLIRERRPSAILGEQVASKDAEPWLDLVSSDLEGLGYAFGALAFPSAGVGAPHIRDRTYFVANAKSDRHKRRGKFSESPRRNGTSYSDLVGGMAHADSRERNGFAIVRGAERDGADARRSESGREPKSCGDVCGMADADGGDAGAEGIQRSGEYGQQSQDSRIERIESAGPTNGFWRDADWLLCRDEKWRPVEPGTFPLADGAPSRVGRLRAYGNAINAYQAAEFIAAARETIDV